MEDTSEKKAWDCECEISMKQGKRLHFGVIQVLGAETHDCELMKTLNDISCLMCLMLNMKNG